MRRKPKSTLYKLKFPQHFNFSNNFRALDLEDTLNEKALRKNHFKSGYREKIGFDRIYKLSEVSANNVNFFKPITITY